MEFAASYHAIYPVESRHFHRIDLAPGNGPYAPMLRISDITFAMEGRPLLENASAVIPTGHKVGLVGRNGSGKTTLFRLIRGELALEGGDISTPKGARIGGVAQEVPSNEVSLLNTVLAADVERTDLLAEAETSTDPERIADIHARLADIQAHSAEARAATILSGLGFDQDAQLRPCSDFSGGWRMRVALAAVLFSAPDILLLDEPTNYLDLEGTLWLETYLAKYPHTVLVISHDRTLLNRSVTSILHLDQKDLTLWNGNYDQFDRLRREKQAQQQAVAKKQDNQRKHLQSYVDRFRYKADKAKQAQSRLKMIARMEPIAAMEDEATIRFTFPSPEELAPPIVKLEDVSVGYDGKPVLSKLDLRIDQDDRIALLGNNGQGKSTLSKLLAGELKPMVGRIQSSSKLRIGYFAQHQVEALELDETPIETLRRHCPGEMPGKLRARLAGGGLQAAQAETLIGNLSGGQKSRLSLLLATLNAPHILILDEPTNHLDIQSREALVQALLDYSGAVILVSHDPHLVSLTADRLLLVKDGAVREFDGDIDSYRAALLAERGVTLKTPKAERSKPKKPAKKRQEVAPLQSEVSKCEARITKLEEMRQKLNEKLQDPQLYRTAAPGVFEALQRKDRELDEAMAKAEALWIAASDALEDAKAG